MCALRVTGTPICIPYPSLWRSSTCLSWPPHLKVSQISNMWVIVGQWASLLDRMDLEANEIKDNLADACNQVTPPRVIASLYKCKNCQKSVRVITSKYFFECQVVNWALRKAVSNQTKTVGPFSKQSFHFPLRLRFIEESSDERECSRPSYIMFCGA